MKRLPHGTLERLWKEPRHWRFYFNFYHCQEDPRFIVPKRNPWFGWTLNFGHRSAWVALFVVLLCITLPLLYLVNVGQINTWLWFGAVVGIVVLISASCWFLASPSRHEEAETQDEKMSRD
ncbi:MAG: hypothetical protein HC904_00025 [Blastochloris sp.]|nr:hypothetical protein [Blastochloris sp.]